MYDWFMKIVDYKTKGGKNLIMEYIDSLPEDQKLELYDIRSEIRQNGIDAFEKLTTRQLVGKMWEIKASQNRVMYVIASKDVVAFLHACKKQKGKAEKKELDKALKRAKREGLM